MDGLVFCKWKLGFTLEAVGKDLNSRGKWSPVRVTKMTLESSHGSDLGNIQERDLFPSLKIRSHMKLEPYVNYLNKHSKEAFLTLSKGIRSIEWHFSFNGDYIKYLFQYIPLTFKFQVQLSCLLGKEGVSSSRIWLMESLGSFPKTHRITSISSPCEIWQTSVSVTYSVLLLWPNQMT